jgi:hypothetical protein
LVAISISEGCHGVAHESAKPVHISEITISPMDVRTLSSPVGVPSPRIPEADDAMVSDLRLVIGNELFMRPVEVSASIRTQVDLGTLILT